MESLSYTKVDEMRWTVKVTCDVHVIATHIYNVHIHVHTIIHYGIVHVYTFTGIECTCTCTGTVCTYTCTGTVCTYTCTYNHTLYNRYHRLGNFHCCFHKNWSSNLL